MALGKMKKYKSRNKKYKRKKNRKKSNTLILRRIGGFPDSIQVKLRYSTFIQLNPSPASPAQHLFRCLSLYDPDYTRSLGDHQPMYFDQWAGIYTKYTVKGAKITMSWIPGSTSLNNQNPAVWGIYTSTNITGVNIFTDTENILEAANSTDMRTNGMLVSGLTHPSKQSTVTSTFSTRKFFGITDPNDGNSYSAETGTNPSQNAYFCCYSADVLGNDPAPQDYYIQIDYIAEFRDRRPIDGS